MAGARGWAAALAELSHRRSVLCNGCACDLGRALSRVVRALLQEGFGAAVTIQCVTVVKRDAAVASIQVR